MSETPRADPPRLPLRQGIGAPLQAFKPRPSRYYRVTRFIFLNFVRLYNRLEVRGLENVPPTGPLLILCNHTSFVDPPLVGSIMNREVYFLSREGILKVPLLGAHLRRLNVLTIRRGASDRDAMKLCRLTLETGWPLVFFPEGTRSRDGRLGPIQPGFAMLLDGIDAPYLPVRVEGADRVLPRSGWFPKPARLRVHIGKPRKLPAREPGERARGYYERCGAQVTGDFKALGVPVRD